MSPGPFKQRITITRQTSTLKATGGAAKSNATLHESIRASIQQSRSDSSSRERMQFDTPQVLATHRIYTMDDVSDVRKEDIVENDDTGTLYLVQSVSDMAGQGRAWCIYATTK